MSLRASYESAPSGIAFLIDGERFRTGSAGRLCFLDVRDQFGEDAALLTAAEAVGHMAEARARWPDSRRPNLRAGESEINVEGFLLALGFSDTKVSALAARYRSGSSASVNLAQEGASVPVGDALGSGSVFLVGSDDEVRAHLESVFGTPAFRMRNGVIHLELPLTERDGRARTTGETTVITLRAARDWTVKRPERGHWSHAVPAGISKTLCGIGLAEWTSGVRVEEKVTCPWCRARLIAIEIAAPPAGEGPRGWTSRCVYTMRHTRELEECARSGGHVIWRESRAWKTGREIVENRPGEETVPIIFSAAERDSGLIYYAQLESVTIDDEGTKYEIVGLQALSEARPLSALTVVSSGEPLPDTHIRPYAICYTPEFLPPPGALSVSDRGSRPTLHAEIASILDEEGNSWLTTEEIAKRVNERGAFRKKDGSLVTAFQIHGRTRNYADIFERDGSRVRLRNQ